MSDLAEIWTVSATQNNSGYVAVFCLIQETVWARIQEMGRVQKGVVFSCCGYFLYSLGVSFDSSEMIYINIHQRNKRNGPDTGLVWSMPGILGLQMNASGSGKYHQDILQSRLIINIWRCGPGSEC